MKKFYPFLIVLIVPVILLLQSNSGGSAGGKTGSAGDNGVNCTQCHTGTPQNATNWITTDFSFTGYVPGETYTITATATHASAVKIGFELNVEDLSGVKVGQLTVTDPTRTKLTNANKAVTHTAAGNIPSGGSNTWSMDWTAPSTPAGTIAIYAAFNAANGNGSPSGDVIYLDNLFIQEAPPPVLSSIQPDQAYQGDSLSTVIKGQNTKWLTDSVSDVYLQYSSDPFETITAASVTIVNNLTINADFTIPTDASPGLWHVKVDDLTLSNAFSILLPTYIGENNALSSVSVYPVPASRKLNITGLEDAIVAIYQLSGALVLQIDHTLDKQILDVSSLPVGIYMLKMIKEGQVRTEKIIISR